MILAPLLQLLAFLLPTAATPSPPCSALAPAPEPAPGVRLAGGPIRPAWGSVSARQAQTQDDEVEEPDESEDDRPDEPGSAIPSKGSSGHPLGLLTVSSPCRPTSPSPTRLDDYPASLAGGRRFLSLCRLLL
jgi:hypothetical protein